MSMRSGIVIPIVLWVLVGVTFGIYYYSSNRISPCKPTPTCADSDSIESHIYRSDRVVVYEDCLAVSGAVNRGYRRT